MVMVEVNVLPTPSHVFINIGEDDTAEVAEEVCVNMPSALAQPCAQDGGAQVAPGAMKKRKRATENDGQAPHHNTGKQTCQPLQHCVTPSRNDVSAVVAK